MCLYNIHHEIVFIENTRFGYKFDYACVRACCNKMQSGMADFVPGAAT